MNPVQMWLVIGSAALAVVLLGVIVVRRRRRRIATAQPAEAAPVAEASPEVFGSLTEALGAQLPLPRGMEAEIQKELAQAGYHRPTALREFNAFRFVLVIVPILFTGVVAVILPPAATRNVLIAGAGAAVLTFSIPRVLLGARGRTRVKTILRGLPDAVDLVNMGVSRGLTFGVALERVLPQIRDVHPELAHELEIVQQQAQVYTFEHAMRQLEKRLEAPEVRTLTNMLTQTDRLGTSLTTALDTYAGSLRATLKQSAEQAASTAPFKLLFPIVLCLVPAVYLVLIGPAILEIGDFINNRDQIMSRNRDLQARLRAQSRNVPYEPTDRPGAP
jgi:tight adherence protein C